MLKLISQVLLVVLFAMTLSACAVVGGVFKAGMAVGIFAVVIVVILLFFLFGRR
jgi:hypothetical protein